MATLPAHGRPWQELSTELDALKSGDFSWRDGRMFLYYYYLNEDLQKVQQNSYLSYWYENGMAHKAFPSVEKLERDVIEIGLELMHAPVDAAATFTSGGSESIFLAMKTARDWARSEKGITSPNLVAPRTCHPTFDRACHYLGVEVRRVPTTRADFRAEPSALRARMDANTMAVVGSAPNYPFGVFDPIEEIAALAADQGVWMHVDACVGGFLAPWIRKLGYDIPAFDFAIRGVTSMSADLHKYGMAPKGASLLLLRDKELQRHQRFEFNDWERGAYVSMTTTGTRPAGAVAGAWAVLNYLGEDGYLDCARIIMDTKRRMVDGIDAIPGLEVLKPHELCIFVYKSVDPEVDIGFVADALVQRGWFVGRQAEPRGIHLALNPVHAESVARYLEDLAASVAEVRGRIPNQLQTVVGTY